MGCSLGETRLVTRDLRTLIYLLNLELREECSRTLGWNPAGAASGCMQSGILHGLQWENLEFGRL